MLMDYSPTAFIQRLVVDLKAERDAALAAIAKANKRYEESAYEKPSFSVATDMFIALAAVDTSVLAAQDAELMAERDAALAVIAEVREALAPGRPLYAALGAARAALEKVAG